MTNYPAGLDAAPQTYTDWTGDPALAPTTAIVDANALNLIFSALVALETALGLNPAGASASVAARIAAVEAALGKIGGTVAVTGTPTAGQVPTATSGTAATWQTPAAGSSIAFTDRGAWAATTAYVVGDIITQAGLRYVCKTAHTSAGSFSGTNWVALDLDLSATYAPLASPAFTGTPTVPTATPGTNTTQAATTAFVTAAVAVETSRATTAEAGAAQKSANLSDLANAATARTNLGLGGAAVLNVGTTTGTVAAGDDSRITGAASSAAVTAAQYAAIGAALVMGA